MCLFSNMSQMTSLMWQWCWKRLPHFDVFFGFYWTNAWQLGIYQFYMIKKHKMLIFVVQEIIGKNQSKCENDLTYHWFYNQFGNDTPYNCVQNFQSILGALTRDLRSNPKENELQLIRLGGSRLYPAAISGWVEKLDVKLPAIVFQHYSGV